MNRKIKYAIWLVISIVIFLCIGLGYVLFAVDTSQSFPKPIYVEIPSGANTNRVAKILRDNKLLKYPKIFVYTAMITGMDKKIRAGRFRFDEPISLWELIKKLSRGGSFDIAITVPEGFTIYKIAGLVHRELGIDSIEFIAECQNKELLRKLKIPGPTAEGFLFPETYDFPEGIDADSIISIMFGEFRRRWKPRYSARAESLKLSLLDVVTLASIIESEAHRKSEQPIISSVYHNRLKLGMMLQADPTTIYGLKKFDKPLTLKDLDSDSPYNTYRHFGLPPGPICNPGEDAIRAALYPDSTDYLYFVSRRDGTHIFSKTIQEHHKAIERVKKLIRTKSKS